MFSINKCFTLTRSFAWSLISRQYFSTPKEFAVVSYNMLPADLNYDLLKHEVSEKLGKPYLGLLKKD